MAHAAWLSVPTELTPDSLSFMSFKLNKLTLQSPHLPGNSRQLAPRAALNQEPDSPPLPAQHSLHNHPRRLS